MTPQQQPIPPPDVFTDPAQPSFLSPHVPPVLPAPSTVPGSTQDVVLPVLPDEGTLPFGPVNPVNEGNQAGLTQIETEGITEGIVPKTFKLPSSVMKSLERAVDKLNEVTPGNTTHSYGVNLLSRHEELIGTAQALIDLKGKYQKAALVNSQLAAKLQQAQFDLADLANQLDAALKSPGTPPPAPQAAPVEPPTTDLWYQRYQDAKQELQVEVDAHEKNKELVQSLGTVIQVLPQLIEQLCVEAANKSWQTPEYYTTYFEELLAPHLK